MYSLATVLPFVVCLVWSVIGLLDYKKADPAKHTLFVFSVTATLLYFCHYLHFNGLNTRFSEGIYFLCNMSVYPLYAMYVERLTHKRLSFWLRDAWWFIPALLFCVATIIWGGDAVQGVNKWVFPIVSIAAILYATRLLLLFRKRVDNYYSNPEEKRLDPVLVLLFLQLVTLVASFIVNLAGRDSFMGEEMLLIPSVIFSVLLFGIFYVGGNTDFTSEEVQQSEDIAPSASLNENQRQQLMQKIEQQMLDKELFRTKGLTISDLAEAVGSNRTYVSSCINQCAGMSFSEYVNGARVRYVLSLVVSQPDLPVSELADKAGFNDRTTFYRSFKKATGMSPSEYAAAKNAGG
jgi:AraC-like DNA-binding protein